MNRNRGGSQTMKGTGIVRNWLAGPLLGAMLGLWGLPAFAQTALQDISFSALSGAQFEIELTFSGTPPPPDACSPPVPWPCSRWCGVRCQSRRR